jgi:hypothetical protein
MSFTVLSTHALTERCVVWGYKRKFLKKPYTKKIKLRPLGFKVKFNFTEMYSLSLGLTKLYACLQGLESKTKQPPDDALKLTSAITIIWQHRWMLLSESSTCNTSRFSCAIKILQGTKHFA